VDQLKARMQQHRSTLLFGVPLLFILLVIIYYMLSGQTVSTDNAYVQGRRVGINAHVSGQVTSVHVKDNQRVNKGDLLFELDNRAFKIAVENAQAQLIYAKLEVLVLKAAYMEALTKALQAEHNYKFAQEEYERQVKLVAANISSEMQLNKAGNDYYIAKQQSEAANQGVAAALANMNNKANIPLKDHPVVQQAQANLDNALLNLEYTLIRAPSNGIVTKVDMLQPGDSIKAGEPVFALISLDDIWVEANFKETQITHMKVGQDVKIEVDAYPDIELTGKISSMSPGTGATFSLLPPENATGNWVKIVQRVPVRIAINHPPQDVFLVSGLSTNVTVDIKNH
jgi:membrane fusion protein (multidrug efflux system)